MVGEVKEERLLVVLVPIDELERLVKPDIGAVPGELLGCVVFIEVDIVEVVVAPESGVWVTPPPPMMHGLGEALILRTTGVVVAQMPLAEHAGVIAVGREAPRRASLRAVFISERPMIVCQTPVRVE